MLASLAKNYIEMRLYSRMKIVNIKDAGGVFSTYEAKAAQIFGRNSNGIIEGWIERYVPRNNNLEGWKIVGVAKHDMYYNEGTQYERCLVYGIEKNGHRILIGEEEIEILSTGETYEIE